MSAFVRDSVKAALIESEREASIGSVMELDGKYNSCLGDLSENHNAYLEDGW